MALGALDKIIELTYEAAFEDEAWELVVRELGLLFGDAAIAIDDQASMGGSHPLITMSRFDPDIANRHFEEYTRPQDNPGMAAVMREPVGSPFTMDSFVDQRTYESDPDIQAILKPQEIDKALMVVLERSPASLSYANIFRTRSQPDFDKDDLALYQRYAPHLRRALDLRRLFLRGKCKNSIARQKIIEGESVEGHLIVNQCGTLLDADAHAAAILDLDFGLHLCGNRLVSDSRLAGQSSRDLYKYLAHEPYPKHPFVIRAGEQNTLSLKRYAPDDRIATYASPSHIILSLRLVQTSNPPNLDTFSTAYGLTRAENRVLERLTQCATATQAARDLQISRETMKSHLHNIYAKTACASLPQLLLLVGRYG